MNWIEQAEISSAELVAVCIQARAIVSLCERAAWNDLQNEASGTIPQVAEDIQFALKLAAGLLVPIQDALEGQRDQEGGGE
ncbi:hypothetical protein ASD50_07545 [Mesorhizobium sp. Root552]|jgi:hypothetical protein|uniref:hypothetical protein n=1 Tax=Mesorhizobium sp. Root552 TaxID=1736555 RepID=UPI0006F35B2E|nr:hypothetical protein [Mesorhizobium sp. Root552]KQZ19331.1 hypothetical protein ASD50_07545 [Mesorhizobium sp. Root552]